MRIRPERRANTADLARFKGLIADRTLGPHSFVLLLGLQTFDWSKLIETVNRGLPYRSLDHLRENAGLPEETLLRWIQLAPRTADRRKQQGHLEPNESDRVLRAARILGKALELFEGNREHAVEWLLTEQPALGGSLPVEVSQTELGAREVENLLGRLEHGVFS